MTKRHTPPARNSKLDVVVVKPFGPHHCARCSGLVNAENTSARDASKMRMPLMTFGSLSRSRLFLSAIFPLLARRLFVLALQFAQVNVEAVETLFPEPAVALEPLVDALERLR